MLYRNQKLDEAFEFIRDADFDIFCIQEVPEAFLARLETLSLPIAYRIDMEKIFPTSIMPMYNVILSKYPLEPQGEILFDEYWERLPFRTRFFVHFMPHQLFSKIKNRGGLYVDTTVRGETIRVFNLHLVLAQPEWRLKEFERAMLERNPAKPTIVCGDFNILEKPHITPLNWILGGRLSDAFLHSRERTTVERHFAAHELVNTLRGQITHPLSQSQLDHILVSHSLSIKSAEVIPARYGSDHHPVKVEIA